MGSLVDDNLCTDCVHGTACQVWYKDQTLQEAQVPAEVWYPFAPHSRGAQTRAEVWTGYSPSCEGISMDVEILVDGA